MEKYVYKFIYAMLFFLSIYISGIVIKIIIIIIAISVLVIRYIQGKDSYEIMNELIIDIISVAVIVIFNIASIIGGIYLSSQIGEIDEDSEYISQQQEAEEMVEDLILNFKKENINLFLDKNKAKIKAKFKKYLKEELQVEPEVKGKYITCSIDSLQITFEVSEDNIGYMIEL